MAPTLVLLHGFTHTGVSWQPVAAGLGGRYRVVAPDIRGHGSAGGVEPVTVEAVLADVDAAAGAEPFTLCGYSMGGRLALHVALGLGVQRVRRLVLIGASPGIEDAGERAARRAADEALADSIEGMSIEAFASRWATETAVLAGQSESVLAFVAADRLRNTPAGLARALRGLGTGALPSLWDRLGELTMPVELIVGERDAKFTEIAMRMVARGLRVATPVEVAGGAGHAVHLEAPRVVASRLGAAERP